MNTCKLWRILLCSTILTAVSISEVRAEETETGTGSYGTQQLYEAIYGDDGLNKKGGTQEAPLTEDIVLNHEGLDTPGFGVSQGELNMYAKTDMTTTPYTHYVVGVNGSMAIQGTDATPSLVLAGIGRASYEEDSDGVINSVSLKKYWTNVLDSSKVNTDDASADYAALVLKNATGKLQENVFAASKNTNSDTTNGNGGAIRLGQNSSTELLTNIFALNETARFGGGVDLDDSTAKITDMSANVFFKNKAGQHGGGMDVEGTIEKMTNNQFSANEAGDNGGGIHVESGTITTGSGNWFVQNTAGGDGGAMYIGLDEDASNPTASSVTLTGSQYKNNTATGNGGAVYVQAGNTFNSTDETYTGNNAASGAAIYNAGTTTIENATIGNNTATANGGALYNSGTMLVKGTTRLTDNTAALGSNAYNAEGGKLTFSDIQDSIDLDYSPYLENGKTNPGGTLFDQDGDIYNAGTMDFVNSKIQLHNGINTNSTLTDTTRKVGTVNIDNTRVDLGGADVDGTGVIYADTVNINEGSTIQTHVGIEENKFGRIEANDITVSENNTSLGVIVGVGTLGDGETKDFEILNASNPDGVEGEFGSIQKNKLYDIVALGDGTYRISKKDGGEGGGGSEYCPDGDCDKNENNTLEGWLDAPITENDTAKDIQNRLNELAQTVGCADEEFRNAVDALAPDVSPLIQAHATEITRRLAAIVSERFYNSMERTGYVHNGKRFYRFPRHESNLWVQGMYGKSKYDVRKGWDMDTEGIAVGFDGHVTDALRMGLSYAYTKADGTAVARDTEIDSHTGMIYGEYNPNRFYANWLAMYTRSQYSESKNIFGHSVKADYDVDAIGAQLMLGRKMGPYVSGNWASGVIKPELGLRYIYTKQHEYTDSVGQKVGSADGQTLTGILGAQYTIAYTLSPSISWYPEFRAALTYDFIEPDTNMRVNLVNGSTYEVETENMDRFGIEVGAKVGIDINRKTEIAVEYEGLFKGDYTNHTGLANLKYKF